MANIVSCKRDLKSTSAFLADRNGNTATLFALAALPLLAVVGSAVDYANGLRVKETLQSTLDSGVIAGATVLAQGKSKSDAESAVKAFVAAKFTAPDGTPPDVVADANNAGAIAATARLNVPTHFMRIFGQPTMAVKVSSEALFGAQNSEVVIALDVTGSMAGAKLAAAKGAASDLVDKLFEAPGASSRVKVGFVPFNAHVNVGTTYAGASWLTSTATYTTPYAGSCYPTYPSAVYGPGIVHNDPATNDGVPYIYTWTEYPIISLGAPVDYCYPAGVYTSTWDGGVGSRSALLEKQDTVDSTNRSPALFDVWYLPRPLLRLTNNTSTLKSEINAATALGETYIQPGLAWGWRVLSPNAPFADGAAYGSAKKILVLMTDGANTISATYPGHAGNNVNDANQQLVDTCAAMKAAPSNIAIYTIAFNVTDATIKSKLQACASGGSYFFDANTIAEMTAAFQQIGAALTGVQLSK